MTEKKIKNMTEAELKAIVAKVVYRITDPIQDVWRAIIEQFEKIERRMEQEIAYPSEHKAHIIKEIRELNEKLKRFLERNK